MGFRSTLVTEQYCINWPSWLFEKYPFIVNHNNILTSKNEFKAYALDKDIHKALVESGWDFVVNFVAIYLHECGGITRVQFEKDRIVFSEPREWEVVEHITHSYCYGCSSVPKENKP